MPASPVVRAGDWVYVSGMPPVNPETGGYDILPIDQQARRSLEHLKSCLEAAGSGLDRVVKCTVYCSNPATSRPSTRSTPSISARTSRRGSSSARAAGSARSTSSSTAWRWCVMNRVWLGTLLLVASATAYSTAGFFTRLIPVDAWTLLFWRGLFGGAFLAVVVAWQQRGRLWPSIRAMGWEGVLVAVCSAVATVCFLNAMRLTAVADVMVIDAAIPFITAAMAWLILRRARELVDARRHGRGLRRHGDHGRRRRWPTAASWATCWRSPWRP